MNQSVKALVLSEAYEQIEEMDKGQVLYKGWQSGLVFWLQVQRLRERSYLCTYETGRHTDLQTRKSEV